MTRSPRAAPLLMFGVCGYIAKYKLLDKLPVAPCGPLDPVSPTGPFGPVVPVEPV